MAESDQTRYFVTKCDNIHRLYTARDTSIWACMDRKIPPQPREILTEAFSNGPVVLIFSVTNCHGWHGVATMETPPDSVATETDNKQWYKFRIKWDTLFATDFGEQSLTHKQTVGWKSLDGTELNKTRNMQEIPAEVGVQLCAAIRDHYGNLCEKRDQKVAEKLEDAWFVPGEGRSHEEVWDKLIGQVKQMGTVLIACAFGSQRYNLSTEDSDVDMFVVYAAPTSQLLGFNPPPHTYKNRDCESCDYTVHEVHRYCELLLAGDPRCVETLYLHPSCVVMETPQWRHLVDIRASFLTRQCLDKYVRDATGAKGTRLLDKWVTKGVALETPMPPKVAKLFYIILRLLQNARDVTEGTLRVYRAHDSHQRALLLTVRRRQGEYSELRGHVDSLLSDIRSREESVPHRDTSSEAQREVHQWLVQLRFEALKQELGK